ncbi:MAG: hypothetical protein WDW38_002414 [Sanguina aurantia]
MSDASKFPIPTQTLRYQVEALRGKDEQEKLAVLIHIADLVEENDTVKEAALGSGLTTAISESVQASSISTAEQQQVVNSALTALTALCTSHAASAESTLASKCLRAMLNHMGRAQADPQTAQASLSLLTALHGASPGATAASLLQHGGIKILDPVKPPFAHRGTSSVSQAATLDLPSSHPDTKPAVAPDVKPPTPPPPAAAAPVSRKTGGANRSPPQRTAGLASVIKSLTVPRLLSPLHRPASTPATAALPPALVPQTPASAAAAAALAACAPALHDLQLRALELLGSIVSSGSTAITREAGRPAHMALLLDLCAAERMDTRLAEMAMGVLTMLAAELASNRNNLVEAGGVQKILAVLSDFRLPWSVRGCATHILASLCTSSGSCQAAVAEGTIGTTLSTIQSLVNSPSAPDRATALEDLLAIVSAVAADPTHRCRLLTTTNLVLLLTVYRSGMQDFRGGGHRLATACAQVLQHLSGEPSVLPELSKAEVLSPLLQLVCRGADYAAASNPKDVVVLHGAWCALGALCKVSRGGGPGGGAGMRWHVVRMG